MPLMKTTHSTVLGLLSRIASGDLLASMVLDDAIGDGLELPKGVSLVAITVAAHRHLGREVPAQRVSNAFALVTKGESIRLVGVAYKSAEDGYDVTYRIGDQAEYDSFNLSYYGTITSITDKVVTISKPYDRGVARLVLSKFSSRNWNFNVHAIAARNSETMMYI